MKVRTMLTLFMLTITNYAAGQNQFNATVLDRLTNEPLIGAKVILKGTTIGTITDLNGKATISSIPNGEQTFIVSYIGYEPIEFDFAIPV